MKKIGILVVHNALIAAIGNAQYVFEKVNEFLVEAGESPFFSVKLIGLKKEIPLNNGHFKVEVDVVLSDRLEYDLIIIPPMSGNMKAAIVSNSEFFDWIKYQYEGKTEIASLCVGSFLLGATGLLDGQECSTHWQFSNEFRNLYPNVRLVDDKVVTDFDGLYTSGGANSYWNLLIYLVEKFVNRDLAIKTSKYFEVEMGRESQSIFMIFEGLKSHGDDVILATQRYIEMHYQEKIFIDKLADLASMSRRTFQRRFKKATNHNLLEYIQKVRIEAAKKELEIHHKSINEVMDEVGYNDPKAFRDVFKRITGISPLNYKNRYNKQD